MKHIILYSLIGCITHIAAVAAVIIDHGMEYSRSSALIHEIYDIKVQLLGNRATIESNNGILHCYSCRTPTHLLHLMDAALTLRQEKRKLEESGALTDVLEHKYNTKFEMLGNVYLEELKQYRANLRKEIEDSVIMFC